MISQRVHLIRQAGLRHLPGRPAVNEVLVVVREGPGLLALIDDLRRTMFGMKLGMARQASWG